MQYVLKLYVSCFYLYVHMMTSQFIRLLMSCVLLKVSRLLSVMVIILCRLKAARTHIFTFLLYNIWKGSPVLMHSQRNMAQLCSSSQPLNSLSWFLQLIVLVFDNTCIYLLPVQHQPADRYIWWLSGESGAFSSQIFISGADGHQNRAERRVNSGHNGKNMLLLLHICGICIAIN